MAKPFRLVVRAAIFDKQGQGLLLRRSSQCKNFVGRWEWLGGKVDEGEDFATALVREVREETSLDVEIVGLAGATQYEMGTANVILLCLEAPRIVGEVHLSNEHDDFAWAAREDLQTLDICPQFQPFAQAYSQTGDRP